MLKQYYGADKLKKGCVYGSMKGAVEQNQIRLYGLKKVDPILMKAIHDGKYKPDSEVKIIEKLMEIKPKYDKLKKQIEQEEDDNKKELMKKELEKIKKQGEKLNSELDKAKKYAKSIKQKN